MALGIGESFAVRADQLVVSVAEDELLYQRGDVHHQLFERFSRALALFRMALPVDQ